MTEINAEASSQPVKVIYNNHAYNFDSRDKESWRRFSSNIPRRVGAVYMDPPSDSTRIKLKYDTLTGQEIRAMPIGGLLD
jgi:hypothetical protein